MAKHDAYRQLAEAQLEEQRARIRLLKAQAKKLMASGKVEAYRQIDELDLQLGNLKATLEGMAAATDDAWDELREGFERIRDQVSKSIQRFAKTLD